MNNSGSNRANNVKFNLKPKRTRRTRAQMIANLEKKLANKTAKHVAKAAKDEALKAEKAMKAKQKEEQNILMSVGKLFEKGNIEHEKAMMKAAKKNAEKARKAQEEEAKKLMKLQQKNEKNTMAAVSKMFKVANANYEKQTKKNAKKLAKNLKKTVKKSINKNINNNNFEVHYMRPKN